MSTSVDADVDVDVDVDADAVTEQRLVLAAAVAVSVYWHRTTPQQRAAYSVCVDCSDTRARPHVTSTTARAAHLLAEMLQCQAQLRVAASATAPWSAVESLFRAYEAQRLGAMTTSTLWQCAKLTPIDCSTATQLLKSARALAPTAPSPVVEQGGVRLVNVQVV
jgi:hypothetical protein